MKKFTASLAFTILFTAIAALVFSTNIFASDKRLGDVDSDGYINSADASIVLQYYSLSAVNKLEEAESLIEDMNVADVDSDGFISSVDASYILSYYASISVGGTPSWPSTETTTTTTTTNTINILKNDEYFYTGSAVVELKIAPNMECETLSTLPNGEKFTVVEIIDSDWIEISIPKCTTQFFVYLPNISTDLELYYRPSEILVGQSWKFNGRSWNIRTGASLESPSTGKYLSNGDIINVLDIYPNNWVKITLENGGEYVQIDVSQFFLIED